MFPLTIFYFGYMFIPIFILVLRDITLLDTPIVNTYGTNQKENPGFKEREKERKEIKKKILDSIISQHSLSFKYFPISLIPHSK